MNVPESWLYTVSIHRQCVYFLYQVTITCKIETKYVKTVEVKKNGKSSTGIYSPLLPQINKAPPPDKQNLPDRCDGWSIRLVISW